MYVLAQIEKTIWGEHWHEASIVNYNLLLITIISALFSMATQACMETSVPVGPMNLFANRVFINSTVNTDDQKDAVISRFSEKSYQSLSYLVVVKKTVEIEGTTNDFPKIVTTYEVTKFKTADRNNTVSSPFQYKKTFTIEKNIYPPGLNPKGGVPQANGGIDLLKNGITITSC